MMTRGAIGIAGPLSVVACLGFTLAAVQAQTAPPAATAADASRRVAETRVAELIVQLGDDDFSRREAAAQQLIAIGSAALPALDAGQRHPDREIRFRCQRLVTMIRESDFHLRLAAFANDPTDRDYGLPGWRRFREQFGASDVARALFVDMLRHEGELLAEVEASPSGGGDLVASRADAHQQRLHDRQPREPLPLGSLATLLFLAADQRLAVHDAGRAIVFELCQQPAFVEAMEEGPRREVLRRIAGAAIAQGESHWSARPLLNLAARFEIREGLEPALKIAGNRNVPPEIRQYGILTVARLGAQRHTAQLADLLNDTTACGSPTVDGVRHEVQIRDVALAAIAHLSGVEARSLGFDVSESHPIYVFNVARLGFASDADRQAALARWRAAERRQLEESMR